MPREYTFFCNFFSYKKKTENALRTFFFSLFSCLIKNEVRYNFNQPSNASSCTVNPVLYTVCTLYRSENDIGPLLAKDDCLFKISLADKG